MFHVEQEVTLEKLLFDGGKAVLCPLTNESVEKFLSYLEELLFWNKRINLTGLRESKDIVHELFIDSLACGRTLNFEKDQAIIDIGSGAGIPGIPLKIAFPQLEVFLVEPRQKKTAFLHHIIGTLNLKNVHVISRSVQDLFHDPSFTRTFDRAFARAIRPGSIFPEARSLLGGSGRAVLCRSRALESCDKSWGMTIEKEIEYELPQGYGKRVLTVLKRV